MKRPTEAGTAVYVLIALLVAGVFWLDLATTLGTATGVLYFVPLSLCLMTSRPIAPVVVGLVCVVLIGAGYLLSPPSPVEELARATQLNRSLSAAVVIALSLAGRWFIATKVQLELQEWIKAGHTELSARMQGEQEVGELAQRTLSFLVEYLGAQVGSVYVSSAAGEPLVRRGGYGLDTRPSERWETIVPGQTLVGQAAADGRLIVVNDVPEDYLKVRSGIGAARPRTLILSPTRTDRVVNGVIELGFFTAVPQAALELLRNVSESVGVAIQSAQYRQRQAELLRESQAQAEELTQQQEELRAVNEALEEQTRTLEIQRESLKATESVLRQKATELERASRYKSEFLANMSHELRTPLNSSLILAKLLMDNKDGNLSTEQVKYAESIYSAGNDLLELINDILDLSKIEAGKTDLSFETVHVGRLMGDLKRRFAPLAAEKALELDLAVEAGCPSPIETDRQRVQQILTNLLSNAVKFTEKGSIRVHAARSGSEHVAFIVEDTGIGIPAEQQETIFEAFWQADGAANRKFGGTGLGLSICRELASLMGGDIAVRSAPGQGSAFTLLIPARPSGVRAPPVERESASPTLVWSSASTEPASLSPVRAAEAPEARLVAEDDRDSISDPRRAVLVVEDDPVFARIMRDVAHEFEFQCVLAGTAREGLELARRHEPAAIVLDIGLPDGSGLTVLEALKQDPATRHVPIHVVSVHDHRQLAREMGAMAYALKPVAREELAEAFAALEEHLSRTMKSVLVVEDDPVQRDAISELLAAENVRVAAVETAAGALAELRRGTFDCVVLDLMLPDTDGFELLDAMAEDEGCPVPPVIVYTARVLAAEEEQRLLRYSKSIIVKGARSPERLLEEVTLFLHQVESDLPPDKRRMLKAARDRERVLDGRRVLLVEDDVRNIFALSSLLEPRGIAVEVARNGREALARLEREPGVDLVLMDVMMPEMDGLAATQAIRGGNGRHSGLPIIMVTAKAMPDDRAACLAAGANDYITKPIDTERLLSLLRVWMPR